MKNVIFVEGTQMYKSRRTYIDHIIIAILGVEILLLVCLVVWSYRVALISSGDFLIAFIVQALKGV